MAGDTLRTELKPTSQITFNPTRQRQSETQQ